MSLKIVWLGNVFSWLTRYVYRLIEHLENENFTQAQHLISF